MLDWGFPSNFLSFKKGSGKAGPCGTCPGSSGLMIRGVTTTNSSDLFRFFEEL